MSNKSTAVEGENTVAASPTPADSVCWLSTTLELAPRAAGFHLITGEVVNAIPELEDIEVGLLHLFIQHTSASLAINENADPDVRKDLQAHFEQLAPRNAPYYRHTMEGPDDMPAHIKSVLTGTELSIPVTAGTLALGTWQGIFLCEHRDHARPRSVVLTLQGRPYSRIGIDGGAC
ncbi:MAG: secondary thiamine-phosphate synthase enzyme YjbQ [Pseudomonadota bacterium]